MTNGLGDRAVPQMTAKINLDTSHTAKRLIKLLARAPHTTAELAEFGFTTIKHASTIVKLLHTAEPKRCHVAYWRRGTSGPIAPVWRSGPREDAKRPEPLSSSEKCKRYRKKLRATYGDDYKHIHHALKKNVPGRKVIIDGEVAFQQ